MVKEGQPQWNVFAEFPVQFNVSVRDKTGIKLKIGKRGRNEWAGSVSER